MMTLQQPALAPDQAVHEQFPALLCQDEQLLRAECDDLIAASWPTRSRAHHPPAARRAQQPSRPAALPASQHRNRRAGPNRGHKPGNARRRNAASGQLVFCAAS